MIINKFKNGNINIRMEASDGFYYGDNLTYDGLYNELTMSDLYFNQVNGYMYLTDFNTGRVYDMFNLLGYHSNILTAFFNYIENNKGSVKLHPMSKKAGNEILQDLENGY